MPEDKTRRPTLAEGQAAIQCGFEATGTLPIVSTLAYKVNERTDFQERLVDQYREA